MRFLVEITRVFVLIYMFYTNARYNHRIVCFSSENYSWSVYRFYVVEITCDFAL